VAYRWDFGDSSPLGSGIAPTHTYVTPGGYETTLTVFDGFGRPGSGKVPLSATTPDGRLPPHAQILPSTLSGNAPLAVSFSCDCQAGSAPIVGYLWDFGVASATGPQAAYTFGAGRYHVHLTVVDQAGLTSTDSVEIDATQNGQEPPTCRASALPSAGGVPLTVEYQGSFASAAGVASAGFSFSDGTSGGADVIKTYPSPGQGWGMLLVTDVNGLQCHDRADVTVVGAGGLVPPQILSTPEASATCDSPYQYADGGVPFASGSPPLSWGALPTDGGTLPAGLSVNPATGAASWTPTAAQTGTVSWVLSVSNDAGTDRQLVTTQVSCPPANHYRIGCGCEGAPPGTTLVLIAMLGFAFRRRRVLRSGSISLGGES
jgi:MYXO-CTERM domain-containing protein